MFKLKIVAIFIFSIFIARCAVGQAPSMGEQRFPSVDDARLIRVAKIYPTEIYIGDRVYFVSYLENVSQETIENFCRQDALNKDDYRWTFLSPTDEKYRVLFEQTGRYIVETSRVGISRDFLPGEKSEFLCAALELPPLENFSTDFWTKLNAELSPEGAVCRLCVNSREGRAFGEFEIRVKPRPERELEIFNRWFHSTSPSLFPTEASERKMPLAQNLDERGSLKSSGKSDIWVGWRRFDPWLFIRVGNRKPSDPNNPTTLDGWRKLEREFAPSATRDEIRLTRLQLEYYSAKKGEKSDAAKKELVDWLAGLPEPQRVVLTSFLLSKEADFAKTTLAEKNREALQTLKEKFGEK